MFSSNTNPTQKFLDEQRDAQKHFNEAQADLQTADVKLQQAENHRLKQAEAQMQGGIGGKITSAVHGVQASMAESAAQRNLKAANHQIDEGQEDRVKAFNAAAQNVPQTYATASLPGTVTSVTTSTTTVPSTAGMASAGTSFGTGGGLFNKSPADKAVSEAKDAEKHLQREDKYAAKAEQKLQSADEHRIKAAEAASKGGVFSGITEKLHTWQADTAEKAALKNADRAAHERSEAQEDLLKAQQAALGHKI